MATCQVCHLLAQQVHVVMCCMCVFVSVNEVSPYQKHTRNVISRNPVVTCIRQLHCHCDQQPSCGCGCRSCKWQRQSMTASCGPRSLTTMAMRSPLKETPSSWPSMILPMQCLGACKSYVTPASDVPEIAQPENVASQLLTKAHRDATDAVKCIRCSTAHQFAKLSIGVYPGHA